jgi:hypothetical protein
LSRRRPNFITGPWWTGILFSILILSKIVYIAYATAACYAHVAHDQALFPQIVRQFAAHDREDCLPYLGGEMAPTTEERGGVPAAAERAEAEALDAKRGKRS